MEGERLTPGDDDVVAGPVVFYGLRDAAREDPSFFAARDGGYPSWKTVVELRAGASVTVAAADPRRLGLNYERPFPRHLVEPQELPGAVLFEACDPGVRRFGGGGRVGARTQFNGGFVSAGAGCRTMHVFPGGGEGAIRLRVGFGTADRPC